MVDETEEYVALEPCEEGLHGNRVSLDLASVGATVNIMLAASLIPGQTIIETAAKEPHIVDLANFLNTMGARITGAGTDTIKIKGVNSLRGGTYAIIPDQIEAGTFKADHHIHHTHEGSIGNLCNDQIATLMQQTLDDFHFERIKEAEEQLIKG